MIREGIGIEIITGLYGVGTPEQNALVDRIMGGERAAERFEVYFHWHNLLHELGHGIVWFYTADRPHPMDEEVLVNRFAVAYWRRYGQADKLEILRETVDDAAGQFTRPVGEGVSAMEYAKAKWGQEELYNFNNYGWFQMSCVADVLREELDLRTVLEQMGCKTFAEPPRQLLCYELDAETPEQIVADAVAVLRDWGIVLPGVRVTFDDDLNRHMCAIDGIEGGMG